MHMRSVGMRCLSLFSILGFAVLSLTGCVASGTYKAVKAEAEDLQQELKQERLKVRAIETMYTQRIRQLEDLASRFDASLQRLDGVTKNLVRQRVTRDMDRPNPAGIGIVLDNDSLSTP